jgi:hypothetical protein
VDSTSQRILTYKLKVAALNKLKTLQMKKYAFVLFSIGIVVFSCQKDKDNNQQPSSKVQLLTSAAWKYDTVAVDYNKDGTPETAVPSGYLVSCDLDNNITFKTDSTGILDEGATKCSSTDLQTTPFKWWFKENETVLYSPDPIFGGLSGDVKVKVLTSSKMQVIKEVTLPGLPTTVNIVLDLKH